MDLLAKTRRYGPPFIGRVFGLVVQAVVGWVTLHFASAGDLGFYYVFVAWTLTLGWVLGFGLPEHAMRIVAIAMTGRGKIPVRRLGLMLIASALVSGVVTYLVLTGAAALPNAIPALAPMLWGPDLIPPALITSLGVVGLVGSRIGAQVLKSLRMPTVGLYAEFVFPFFPLLLGAVYIGLQGRLSGELLAWLHVSGGLVTVIFAVLVLLRLGRRLEKGAAGENLSTSSLSQGNLRQILDGVCLQWLAVALQSILLNMPLIVVSLLANEAAAGIFGLCMRLAAMLMIGTDVIISMRGPDYADLHAKGDHKGLSAAFQSSRKAALALTAPLFLALWVLATPILEFFDIADTDTARQVLLVLLVGRLIYAFVGPVSYFLWMIRAFKAEISATALALAAMVTGAFVVSRLEQDDPTLALAFVTMISISVRFMLQFMLARRSSAGHS